MVADKPEKHRQASKGLERHRALIRDSGVFDPDWYGDHYPEVASSGLDPVDHYLQVGAGRGYDPGPAFSTLFYLETHPSLGPRGINPLVHALNHRRTDGGWHRGDVRRTLYAARLVAENNQAAQALELATDGLPADRQTCLSLLRANQMALARDHDAWAAHLNAYLADDGLAPVTLHAGGKGLLDRLGAPGAPHETGPPGLKVSVLLAAFNAADTVAAAVRSVLAQSWRDLELIAVDDASTDGTGDILHLLAQTDARMRVLRLPHNTGPYVARNIALSCATGALVTCQDADDWAHTQRLARHLARWQADGRPVASTVTMLRMTTQGYFGQLRPEQADAPDGARQTAPFSVLYDAEFLRARLGAWDCARFGADTEMWSRAALAAGQPVARYADCCFLSLDQPGSLTNNPETGIHPRYGVTPARAAYRQAWRAWQRGLDPKDTRLDFPPAKPPFTAPADARVPHADIRANIDAAAAQKTRPQS